MIGKETEMEIRGIGLDIKTSIVLNFFAKKCPCGYHADRCSEAKAGKGAASLAWHFRYHWAHLAKYMSCSMEPLVWLGDQSKVSPQSLVFLKEPHFLLEMRSQPREAARRGQRSEGGLHSVVSGW